MGGGPLEEDDGEAEVSSLEGVSGVLGLILYFDR